MFTDNDAYIIGLTGMSGAGKTTACNVFSGCGFAVINCDSVSRIVVQKGKPALYELKDSFGGDILLPDGNLNRRQMGNLIFSDEKARVLFNNIIYPYISYEMIITAVKYINDGYRCILLDAPTLFESGTYSFCDVIVSIVAERSKCIERIMRRDNLTYTEAENRLLSQFSPDYYRERSDYCVENKGSVELLEMEIRSIAEKIGEMNAEKKK